MNKLQPQQSLLGQVLTFSSISRVHQPIVQLLTQIQWEAVSSELVVLMGEFLLDQMEQVVINARTSVRRVIHAQQ